MKSPTVSPGLEDFLKDRQARVDRFLESALPEEDLPPATLHQAMRYAVLAGGKRIRPVLCLAVSEELGKTHAGCLRVAAAIELLHTYSLVHDDLPAMDNDDFRRGKPTTHKVFGEGTAILVGDALLTLSFQWIADSIGEGNDPAAVGEILALFARASGHRGMIGGQVLDLAAEGRTIPLSELQQIHEWKTGALLAAAVEIGALLGGAAAVERMMLSEFGKKLGLLFQVTDDILDVEGEFQKLGKTIGADVTRGKATYPALLGMDEAKRFARRTRDEALNILGRVPEAFARLRDLTDFVLNRSH